MKKNNISIISAFLFFSCINYNNDAITEKKINILLEKYNKGFLLLNSLIATFARDNRFNDQFTDFPSEKYQEKLKVFYSSFCKRLLRQLNIKYLSNNQIVSEKIIEWECDTPLAQANFKNDILMLTNQIWVVNLTVGQLASANGVQPFNIVKDYENWLKRLGKYNDWLHSAAKRIKEGIQFGYKLLKELVKKVIPQFESLTKININTKGELDINKHLFYSPITKFHNSFTNNEKTELTKKYSYFLVNKLISSFERLYSFLCTDYLKAVRKTSDINRIPEGKKYYQYSIKKYTTTVTKADEIHDLELKKNSRMLSEIKKIKLHMEIQSAIRFAVYTGFHAKRWTRQQALQYSLDNEAEPEASVISEIGEYMADPCQALSYKIGQLKIIKLRAKAMKIIEDKFNIKKSYNQILETACIPLFLQKDKINTWVSIKSKINTLNKIF